MDIEVKIDSAYENPKIIILTNEMKDEIREIMDRISDVTPKVLTGFGDEVVKILEESEIYRVYANSGKVFAETKDETFNLRLRLYELEDRLDKNYFVRISNSEIINLKKVENFDLSIAGTIVVKMKNKTITYASRRYVSKIKKTLGM